MPGKRVILALLGVLAAVAPGRGQTVQLQPKMGEPLSGLTAAELQRFQAGKLAFDRVFSAAEGLGPIFNQNSCASCHNNPVGGSGTIMVTRFGFSDPKAGGFDPLTALGGSLLQSQTISLGCGESVPPAANVTAQRVTPSTLGFGLVEAIPDADIAANASSPPGGVVTGAVHMAPVLEQPGVMRVGRFGWKSQLATVLSFSADAALNEIGLTNRLLGTENAPNGNAALLAQCDNVPDPEDGPDPQGFDFIDRVTDFQRFLAPPPQTPRSGMTGEAVFQAAGCADCHVPSFTTPNDPSIPPALRDVALRPYSDFLLHDMGQAADFIAQGSAGEREIRTTPLWGVRVRDPMWHDGSIGGGTFESRVVSAINLHGALLSEAAPSAQAFLSLPQADRDALVAFLDSLGRAEFDSDGDNDVDHTDLLAFQAAHTGPGSFYTPDDPEAVFDVDQDGDVDDDDFDLLVLAYDEDCNGNGVGDLIDIVLNGTSFDANQNLIPDECETCQTDLGFGSPGGPQLSVCGDDLTAPGSVATALVDNAPPGAQLFIAVSTTAAPVTVPGVGTIVPAMPFTVLDDTQTAGSDGRFAAVLPGGGPPVQLVIQVAVFDGPTLLFSNAVQVTAGS